MSLFGVTFKDQAVSAFDHAALMAIVLRDGILRGCGMSASGSNVTLAAGHLLAAGRVIGNDAALTIPVTGSSGVARITLVIDLTATATESTFQQLSIRVDNATDEAALPALVQEDINDGIHTDYEVSLAVVNLGASGVTSFVRKMGRAALRLRYGSAEPTTSDIDPGEIYLRRQD